MTDYESFHFFLVCNMMYSLWNNKKKIKRIIKKLKFCESFDVSMDNIE